MDVSIIIINYKTPELVIDCIESIKNKTKDINYEIIVVDNDSNDDSPQILKNKLDNDIKFVVSDTNLGFGKANNLGYQYATGKYLFLLNSDTLLINNAIKIMFDYLEKNNDVGIVGGNLYSAEYTPNPSYCMYFDSIELKKKESTWKSIFFQTLKRKFKAKSQRIEGFNYSNMPIDVAYIFGADLMISKELFKTLKGFDKDFFMYYEEQELSYRVNKMGYKIINIPDARIIHYDGVSTKKENQFSNRQYQMRLNGAFIYFYKVYGLDGFEDFYKYRLKKINKELKKSTLLRKKETIRILNEQKNCLNNEYNSMKGVFYNGGN